MQTARAIIQDRQRLSYVELQDKKIDMLFKAAFNILLDECPNNPKQYYCRGEDYDETACERCWSEYLLNIVNQR